MKPQEKFELYQLAYKRAEDPAWYTRPLGQAAIAGGAAGLAGALTGKDLRSAIRRALGFGGVAAAATYGGRKGYDYLRGTPDEPPHMGMSPEDQMELQNTPTETTRTTKTTKEPVGEPPHEGVDPVDQPSILRRLNPKVWFIPEESFNY